MPKFQKKAANVLAEVRQELVDIETRTADINHRRDALLLAGDDRGLDALETELAKLRKTAARLADRIRLLEAQAEKEEVDDIARRQKGTIDRVEKKLAQADVLAGELQETMLTADKLLRRIIQIRDECRPTFSLGDAHTNAALNNAEGAALSPTAVVNLLKYELYRIGARPFFGGTPGLLGEVSWPGGQCPRLEWTLQPNRIRPFADAMRAASAFAIDLLRGKETSLAVEVQPESETTSAPINPTNGSHAPAETRLAKLLRRQAELSEDPADEAEYIEIVRQIADLTAGV